MQMAIEIDEQESSIYLGITVLGNEGAFVGVGTLIEDGHVTSELFSGVKYESKEEAALDVYERLGVFADYVVDEIIFVPEDFKEGDETVKISLDDLLED